ncbi:AI-2E family transporter [Chitinophagaceae bacterium MMS25-I14]
MEGISNKALRQYLLIALICGLAVLLAAKLYVFMPGMLGAVTMYILLRQFYFRLTIIYNWKKWLAAIVFILGALLIFVLPFTLLLQMLLPKLSYFLSNANQFSGGLEAISDKIEKIFPQFKIEQEQISGMLRNVTEQLPGLLGATANMLTNTVLAFFILYFMLVDGRRMERTIHEYMPMKDENTDNIWEATRVMVVSNAIGIPVLAACQAIAASLGYFIFGVDQYILWGIITGLFSLVPIVGTGIIWVPICVYLYATGHAGQGTGLLLYSLTVITNIDNVLRFTLLKKLGDVHPVVTVLGIIVGVPLFGFMGFIFGPLLISYLLLLLKIYRVEFTGRKMTE